MGERAMSKNQYLRSTLGYSRGHNHGLQLRLELQGFIQFLPDVIIVGRNYIVLCSWPNKDEQITLSKTYIKKKGARSYKVLAKYVAWPHFFFTFN